MVLVCRREYVPTDKFLKMLVVEYDPFHKGPKYGSFGEFVLAKSGKSDTFSKKTGEVSLHFISAMTVTCTTSGTVSFADILHKMTLL